MNFSNYITAYKNDINTKFVQVLPTETNNTQTSDNEAFQNHVLRPILKFQHTNIIQHFHQYCLTKKWNLESQSFHNNTQFVHHSIKTDASYKHFLIGLICGLFGKNEMEFYLNNKKEINKRILGMMAERVISTFEKDIW